MAQYFFSTSLQKTCFEYIQPHFQKPATCCLTENYFPCDVMKMPRSLANLTLVSPSGYLRLQFTTEYQVNDFEQSWPPSWYLEQEPGFLKACVVINFFALLVNVCHTSNFWRSVPHRINMAMFEIFISFALNHFPPKLQTFSYPYGIQLAWHRI